MEGFLRAVDLFSASEEPQDALSPIWGHEDALAWVGQIRAAEGDLAGAREAYEQVLALSPDFAWVKYQLLPALEELEGGSAN